MFYRTSRWILIASIAALMSLLSIMTTFGRSADPKLFEPPAKIPQRLEPMARALARALHDPNLRMFLKGEIGKKFDGDYDVLFRRIAGAKLANGTTVQERLAANSGDSLQELNSAVAALPRLQIAMPVGFERWNAATQIPIVASMPLDVDDAHLTQVKAFDNSGKEYWLDARTAPDFPVLVISLNERTNDQGKLTFVPGAQMSSAIICPIDPPDPDCQPFPTPEPFPTPIPVPTPIPQPHAYGNQELLVNVKINNDHEPWPRGDPEIYASYSFADQANIRGVVELSDVNDEGRWYTLNYPLFYWQQAYGDTLLMSFWERDGDNWGTFTFQYGPLNYTVQILNGDDGLGAAPVNFLDPNNGYYSTGDAEFHMGYRAP